MKAYGKLTAALIAVWFAFAVSASALQLSLIHICFFRGSIMPTHESRHQRIDAVRRFNRFYTRKIGVLGNSVYRSPFSLTQARVLFEIAHRRQTTAAELVRELGLDPGYLSRILHGFRRRGLVTAITSGADHRRELLSLTHRGRVVFRCV